MANIRRTQRAATLFARGVAAHARKDIDSAEACFRQVLEMAPTDVEALHYLGLIALGRGHAESALDLIDRAIAGSPDNADAHYNRGIALFALGRLPAAIAAYQRATALRPGFASAWFNLGNAQAQLGRQREALASYDQAIELRPDHAVARGNRALTLAALGDHLGALAEYDRALAIRDDDAHIHANRGNTLRALRRPSDAIAAYDRALALQPNYAFLPGMRLLTRMHACDWRDRQLDLAELATGIEQGRALAASFVAAVAIDSPALQRRAAEIWVREKCPPDASIAAPRPTPSSRIRLGYFSADFHNHATAQLCAGLFEHHDRSRFELFAFSYGPAQDDAMRRRLQGAFDRFIDIRDMSDREAIALSRSLNIDIAIDLKGFTQDSRSGLFAGRAAPLQVNYLGYPGTMGAPFIDYIIADDVVVPDSHRPFYSEKIVRLPHSYQVNDRNRSIAEPAPSRAELGLPARGFVFCCFNNSYKITPMVFDCWMRLLQEIEGSVLWLLQGNDDAMANLRREAVRRGVAADRLVFAPRLAVAAHLARHRAADLFLDTLPCNAHTTASDALWAGLPLLTVLGNSFAGRVAASLLRAVGLPELIADGLTGYESLARELALDPARLAAVRARLASNRLTAPLFDTARFARGIEAAYGIMQQHRLAGLPPAHLQLRD